MAEIRAVRILKIDGLDVGSLRTVQVPSLKMPRKPKINLEKVKAALNTICTKCGYAIPPDRICRIDSEQIKCPEFGQRFTPGIRVKNM
jgi:predicted RNA-binding Zn-ribbon protein involved in translation (DUF1610 family)